MADRDHLITLRVSGNCTMPPAHDCGDQVHIVGLRLFCTGHCPACNPPAPPDRNGPVEGLAGVQKGLF